MQVWGKHLNRFLLFQLNHVFPLHWSLHVCVDAVRTGSEISHFCKLVAAVRAKKSNSCMQITPRGDLNRIFAADRNHRMQNKPTKPKANPAWLVCKKTNIVHDSECMESAYYFLRMLLVRLENPAGVLKQALLLIWKVLWANRQEIW